VVQRELASFLARAHARERPLPRFVERELRGFLGCGVLAHGFVRVHCDACGHDRLVAFSCKGRGFCPSCGGRRMADTAAHLVDRVFPKVPVRQWVLSVPFSLRYRLAYDSSLTAAVLGCFVRTVFGSLRRRARRLRGIARGQCGAVTFVQRFGDALNLNVHFHSLVLDGLYEAGPFEPTRFLHLMTPRSPAWRVRSRGASLASSSAAGSAPSRIRGSPIPWPSSSRSSPSSTAPRSEAALRRGAEPVSGCWASETASKRTTWLRSRASAAPAQGA
jgi:hypothetical protein